MSSSSIVASMLVSWMSQAQPQDCVQPTADKPDFIKELQKIIDARYREVRAKEQKNTKNR